MIRWIANHLGPLGDQRACLLGSILAAAGGLGLHVGGLGRCLGHGLGPGLAWGPQDGLDCTLVLAAADLGIQATVKVEGD